MIKRIVVPLDGSSFAESALAYAEQIAVKNDAEILLLSVMHQELSWSTSPVQPDQEMFRLAQAYLNDKSAKLRARGVRVKPDVVEGDPAQTILAHVANGNADLLIMSSHGRSGIKPWALGNVIVKVFHESPCPVFVARPDLKFAWPTEAPSLKKILLPLDGSEVSLAVLPFVKEFARSLDASLILANVILDSVFMPLASDFVLQQTGWAEQFLEKVAQETKTSGLGVSTRVVAGVSVVDAIIRAAEDNKADLIAFSTHGRSGLARWPMGSVADGVAHRASLPCLLVRPPGIQKPA